LPSTVKQQLLSESPTLSQDQQPSLFSGVLTDAEKFVLELLRDDEATHIDRLMEASSLSSPELMSVLCELEMKDKIKQLAGKKFVKRF
jgi:DNA processing protein